MHDAVVVQVLQRQHGFGEVKPGQLQRQRPDVLQQRGAVPACRVEEGRIATTNRPIPTRYRDARPPTVPPDPTRCGLDPPRIAASILVSR